VDITTIRDFRAARTADDLALAEGEVVIAGGTWLMSEPQPATTGFVDLMAMGWPDLEVTAEGLRIGATCTIARLVRWAEREAPAAWTAAPLAVDAANALLASFNRLRVPPADVVHFGASLKKLQHIAVLR